MERVKISTLNYNILIGLILVSVMFRFLPAGLLMQDAWIGVAFATILGTILYSLFLKLSSVGHFQSLFSIFKMTYGNIFSRTLAILYTFYFLFTCTNNLRLFSELVHNSLLDSTSVTWISFTFLAVSLYGSYKGIETITRAGIICSFFSFFIFLFIFLALLYSKAFHLSNITPIMEHSVLEVAKEGTFAFSRLYGELIVLLLIIPYIHSHKDFKKKSILSIIFTSILIIIMMLSVIAVLNPILISQSFFPLLNVTYRIRLAGNFINRIDPLVITLLFMYSFFKITIFLWAGNKALNFAINQKKKKKVHLWLLFFCTISVYISFFFVGKNIITVSYRTIYAIPASFAFGIIIPIITLIVLMIRKRKQEKNVRNA